MFKFSFMMIAILVLVGCKTPEPSHRHCAEKSIDEPWTETFTDHTGRSRTVTFHTDTCIKYACDKGYKENTNGKCVLSQ